jgi:hypothetical protein
MYIIFLYLKIIKKINENLYELRKIIFADELANLTQIEQFNWRY